ncbi:hypothetical protein HYG86_01205 [Alkalicella caledoniensis]|uniref:Uncharacterized protein n=1 Tax=Alkalicella caledoniensis TaxID=2731377 RepID=A0A7G9W469_ALKCA|nr:hypothetical protein [Alkalicella caledoniensis]QNO13481.1 hypothetical protein HYG86_01205 [Alkalicella caledoniensis]
MKKNLVALILLVVLVITGIVSVGGTKSMLFSGEDDSIEWNALKNGHDL